MSHKTAKYQPPTVKQVSGSKIAEVSIIPVVTYT